MANTSVRQFLLDLNGFLKGRIQPFPCTYKGRFSYQYSIRESPTDKDSGELNPGYVKVTANDRILSVTVKRSLFKTITTFVGERHEFTISGNELRCYDGQKTLIIKVF